MAVTRYKTAGDLINSAAVELGLGATADPFAAQDPMFQQLVTLFNTCGKDLCRRHDWSQLRTEWVFTTLAGDTGVYALPADFISMVPQSGWDRTNRRPLGGPLSAQEWQLVQAWRIGVTITVQFRMNLNELWLYPQPPPAGVNVALEYRGSAWVAPGAQAAALAAKNYNSLGPVNGADVAVASGDICLFDDLLLTRYLKLAFRKAKRLDTSSEQDDFEEIFERVKGRSEAHPVLSLTGPGLGLRNGGVGTALGVTTPSLAVVGTDGGGAGGVSVGVLDGGGV